MLPENLKTFLSEHAAKVIAFGVPVDINSSHLKGAEMAPWEIKKMIFHEAGNPFSESGVDLSCQENFTLAGVLQFRPKSWFEDIEASAGLMMEFNRSPIFIGGDHSITYPVIKGLAKHIPNLTILHIDAHPDLYHEYQGNKFSHASPFARIMEEGLVERLIQVGIRSTTAGQREQIKKFGVEVIDMMHWRGVPDLRLDGPLYMTIDMDGLDPAFAPGVSHPEPGGLTTREVLNLIHQAGPHLIGGDVVEYNPKCDHNNITALVAARFVRELAGAMLIGSGPNKWKTKT